MKLEEVIDKYPNDLDVLKNNIHLGGSISRFPQRLIYRKIFDVPLGQLLEYSQVDRQSEIVAATKTGTDCSPYLAMAMKDVVVIQH